MAQIRDTYIDLRTYLTSNSPTPTQITSAIRQALDAAGKASTPNSPCVVVVPRGRWAVNDEIIVPNSGVILQGYGGIPRDSSENANGSQIVADAGHTNTPMFTMDGGQIGGGHQWYRGGCIRGVTFDSNAYNPTGPILKLRGLSNCPDFEDVCVTGHTGVAYDFDASTGIPGAITENITFRNCYAYGRSGVTKTAPAVYMRGCDGMMFIGGLFAGLSTTAPTVAGTTDVPAMAIESVPGGAASYRTNIIGVGFTNYTVHVRIRGGNGDFYGPSGIMIEGCIFEGFNRAIVLNDTAIGGSGTPGTLFGIQIGASHEFLSPVNGNAGTPLALDAFRTKGLVCNIIDVALFRFGVIRLDGTVTNTSIFNG